jgi:hypothetical protein
MERMINGQKFWSTNRRREDRSGDSESRYHNNIKMDLKENVCKSANEILTIHHRDQRRTFVNTAVNRQVPQGAASFLAP